MAVDVVLPAALREYAKGRSEVKGSGKNLATLLADLDGRYPGLRQRVCEDTGAIRQYVSVFVNGDQVVDSNPAQVKLREGDTVHFLPSIAGG